MSEEQPFVVLRYSMDDSDVDALFRALEAAGFGSEQRGKLEPFGPTWDLYVPDEPDGESIHLQDIDISSDGEGIMVSGRGGNRYVTVEELRELASSDHPVEIR